jgi:hypothetical protein
VTWTYDVTKLSTSGKDALRLMIGDTFSVRQQMQDEEIVYFLSARSTLYGAAAECCRTLATRFSSSVDQQAGTTKIAYSQMGKAYQAKALQFEARAAMSGAAMPYAGGISITDKMMQELNMDRVQPNFNFGMTDNTLPVSQAGNELEEETGISSPAVMP